MKHLGKIIGMSVGIILLVGCAQPQFNPNDKRIVMVEGKAFRVPKHGIIYNNMAYSKNRKMDVELIKLNRKLGLNCNYGDLNWMTKEVSDTYSKAYRANDMKMVESIKIEAIRSGKIGCVRPLSNQEYDFYRGQEMQQVADRRAAADRRTAYYAAAANERAARKNLQAAQTAKDVNVNVSGTVDHNVQHSGTVNHNVNVYTPYRY